MADTIVIESLTKKFDSLVAVDHINLSIKEGEIFGFLGPNGAGKTTAIKMLCTILDPTSGSAEVCGYDIVRQRNQVRDCIGIVFQDPSIDTFLTGRENLDFHARMYHMNSKTREKRVAEVLDLMELKGKENIKVSDYSGGIQRRFEVARGFMNHPKVLLLDEPTLGLDIQTRRHLWSYIKLLNKQEGTTVILTTHYIEEADYLCDRVAIIDHGKITVIDAPENLKAERGTNVILLGTTTNMGNSPLGLFKDLDWVENIEQHNGLLELSVRGGEERIPQLIDLADDNGVVISSVDLREPSLEDVFLHYTGRTITEEEGSLKQTWKAIMTRGMRRK